MEKSQKSKVKSQKSLIKKTILFFLIIVSFFCITNFVFADTELHGATESAREIGLKIDTDVTSLIGSLVGTAFSFISVIFFLLMVYAGILWMTARGNEDQSERAKEIIIGSVIGVVLIISAYAITNFVFDNTDFDTAGEDIKTQCDSEAGWQCVDLANADIKCKGEKLGDSDFVGTLQSVTGDDTIARCKNSDYCKTNVENCLGNQICCQLHTSGCKEIYGNDYNCVDDVEKCTTLSSIKYESGLCDGIQKCCLQKQVWCLNSDYKCESKVGNCNDYSQHIGVDPFDSKTACETTPEFINNKQIYCFYKVGEFWQCEPMKKSLCDGDGETSKNGQPFDRIGDCQTALESFN